MREEIRAAMQKMSEQELQELAEMATKLQSAAHERVIIEGGKDILEKWTELLACVRRVRRQVGTYIDFWIDVRDWKDPKYHEGMGEIIDLSRFLDDDDRYTFEVGYRED